MSLLLLLKEGEAGEGTLEAVTGDAVPGSVSATLNGIVKPNGLETKYWFELSEGTGPPEPPTPGIASDEVTESSLFSTAETEVSFEHAGTEEASAAVVYIWHFDADEVGASAVSYGGVPMELAASEVRGASPWPGVQIWVADDIPAGTQTVEITKHTDVRLRAVAQTLIASGTVVVGNADGGSGNNTEPAVPALEAASPGLALGIVGGMWADLPTERAEDPLIQRDEGAQVYDAQMGYVGAGSHVLDWGFGAAANNARAGVVLLDPNPPGPPKEFASGYETGDFSDFDHVQSLPERATVDNETAVEGEYSARLEVQEGDEEPDTGDERSEPVSGLTYVEGDKPYFGFDFLIESHDPEHWQLIHQGHDDGGDEPPFALYLWHDEDENPILLLQHGTGTPKYWEAPRPALGTWNRIVYPVEISSSEGFVGPVRLNGDLMTMLNGEETIGPFNTSGIQPTYDKGPGIYRSTESTGTAVLRADDYRILRTFEASTPDTTDAVDEDVAVSAAVEGLKPGTAYHFRLFAMSEEGLVVGDDETFTTARPSRVAVTREHPPDKLAVRIADPSTGASIARWAEDEAKAENVIGNLRKTGEMPGGHKEMTCSLPRDPRVDWPDLDTYVDVFVEGAGGEKVWEGRIDKKPKTDGERLLIEPAAVGHQAALQDRKALRMGFIDGDLSKWGDPSTQRKIDITSFYETRGVEISSGWQDTGENGPSLIIRISFEDGHPLGEQWYSGDGVRLGALGYDFKNISGVLAGTNDIARLNTTDVAGWTASGTNHGNTSATQQWLTTTNPDIRYAVLQTFYEGEYAEAGTDSKAWQNLKILSYIAAQNLTLQGTWPNVGYTSGQMLRLAIPLFTYLEATEESVEDEGYVTPQAWFADDGTMAQIVQELTKYELLDYFVLHGKLFEQRVPGTYGRRWQAYSGPSELQQTGEDGSRLWDRIVVRYQDVDGRTYRVGWPGSGADVESAALQITDPDHPAVKADKVREDLLDLKGISTAERALEAGERWLKDANELSRSGEATLRGYVMDDKGIYRPASQVQPGDWIRFPDDSDRDYRKIVQPDYTDPSKECRVTLDAPSEALQALLERYQAALHSLSL